MSHEVITHTGWLIGKSSVIPTILSHIAGKKRISLQQEYNGVTFDSPVGLAAGFDYKGELIQILPSLGFGFGTVGTITNHPYNGNPKPRLGRLIKSKSLMVNKGFKNEGVKKIIKKMKETSFRYPVGISIGKTNTKKIKTINEAIEDICAAFIQVEHAQIPFAYYELNISCPNLLQDISFYPPENLRELLTRVCQLPIKKPLYIKMPIERSDKEIEQMLNVVSNFPIQGVIFGNLQKNRQDPMLHKEEIKKYPKGNFSGKPTEKRSNELIRLAYQKYGKKFMIIGCGGIFNAEDAYKKIKYGASLVQLITGLVYEGPLLVSQINSDLPNLLRKDGYQHISEAIGKA